jgi:hypothetical protein
MPLLHHLIYQSRASEAFSIDQLTEQLTRFRLFNAAHDLTGILLYTPDGQFMQLLEGAEEDITPLFHDRIMADPRHFNITVVSEGPWARRSFPNWNMAFMAPGHAQLRTEPGFLELSALRELLPRLTPIRPSLVQLLLEFIEQYENPLQNF